MQDIFHIQTFCSALAEQLQVPLTTAHTKDYSHLASADLALNIFIYYASARKRQPNLTSRTIHIDEEDLRQSPDKIRQRLASLYHQGKTCYARQTVVARIDKRIALAFQAEHHLNAALPGKYRYGLFHQGELVSVAIFSGGRHMREQAETYRSFELLRFCHKSGLRVVGGLSKLIKSFVRDFSPADIMTYVDNDWSQNSSLQTLGFIPGLQTEAQAMLFKNGLKLETVKQDSEKIADYMESGGYAKNNSGSTKMLLIL